MEKKIDLRILKTYKALSEAFFQLLQEKKFEEITVNELCERAMVRRATFYKHFADKYEFFAFFLRTIQERFMEKSEMYSRENNAEPYDYCSYLLQQSIDLIKEHQKIVDSVMKSSVASTLLDIVSDEIYRNVLLNIKDDMRNGLYFSASPEIMASFYTGGIVRLVKYWIEGREKIPEEKLTEEVREILHAFYVGNCMSVEQKEKI